MLAAALPEPERRGGVRSFRDVVFAAGPGYRPLTLDLHRPDDARTVPLIVFIHGGAFRVGRRTMLPPTLAAANPLRTLPVHGWAVASVDYRLSGEAQWPACVHDVHDAIDWLRERAVDLGIDPQRIVVWGESAGGYLALMGAVSHLEDGELVAGGHPGVRGAVAWYPPVDFATMQEQGALGTDEPESPESALLGVAVGVARERARAAGPIAFLRSDAPPMLLMHGTSDRQIPFAQSQQLAEAAVAAGAEVTLLPVTGFDHTFPGHPEPERLVAMVEEFAERVTRPDFD